MFYHSGLDRRYQSYSQPGSSMLRVAGVISKAKWQAGDDSDMQEDSFALMFLIAEPFFMLQADAVWPGYA
jgi:hypothetical protein